MKQIRVTCQRCHGKCQEYSGHPKPTWQACPDCEGKGWVMGTVNDDGTMVTLDQRYQLPADNPNDFIMQKMREYFESEGVKFVDVEIPDVATDDPTEDKP